MELWREVLSAEPLANDANNAVAQLIAETQSPDAAAQHLAEVHERFPYSTSLQQTRIIWLRSLGAAAVAPVARELVEQRPGNVWARVELALCLTRLGEPEEALKQANAALAIAPTATNAHSAAGMALRRLKRLDEARAAFRKAIEISVDFTPAMHELLETYSDIHDQREALAFIHQELVRQVIFGDGLIAYRQLATSVLEPEDLLASLLRNALASGGPICGMRGRPPPTIWPRSTGLMKHYRQRSRRPIDSLYCRAPGLILRMSAVCGEIQRNRSRR